MSDTGPVTYFLCGGFGGVCTVLVGHPLDTIKVRLQTQSPENPIYKGTLDCFKQTIAREGVGGLYKGMAAPLLSISPIFAMSFFGFGMGRMICRNFISEEESYLHYFVSGGISGALTTIVMAPGERIKALLQIQTDATKKQYDGVLDCVVKLYKAGGIRSIYKGTGATLLRDIPATSMYFLASQTTKDILTDNGKIPLNVLGTISQGVAAGVFYWIAGLPADVLKSRIQTAPEGTYPNGIRDALKQLLRTEGYLALYKGLFPVMLRAIPANAACFTGFEIFSRFLNYLNFHM